MPDKETVSIDFDDLTLGEADDFEQASGMSAQEAVALAAKKKPLPVKALIALVWIIKRRDDPKFTLEDARSIKVAEFAPTRPTKGKS